MLQLIVLLVPIALVDSLNPTAIGTIILLLTTPRPVPRVVAAILGFALVYFAFGLAVVFGAGAFVREIGAWLGTLLSDPPPTLYIVQTVLAAGLLVYAYRLFHPKPNADGISKKAFSLPKNLAPAATFMLGIGLNASELPTAVPYLAALERITSAGVFPVEAIVALVIYNLLFVLPLLVILVIFLRQRERAEALIRRVSAWIEQMSGRVIKWGVAIIAVGILADSAAYFATGTGLF